jgi:acetoin utilization deacetylase AcuC-like enzyme/ankyrin repeat protein
MGIEGSPPMHLAVSVGALPGRGGDATAAAALRLLALGGGAALASPYSRDDNGRTPLHWAAHHGLEKAIEALFEIAGEESERVKAEADARQKEFEAAVAAAAAATAGGEEHAPPPPPPQATLPPFLLDVADKQGNTALALAARAGASRAVACLLAAAKKSGEQGAAGKAAAAANRAGLAPLHAAAAAGSGACCALLCAAGPAVLEERCRRGWIPAEWARRRGHEALSRALSPGASAPGAAELAAAALASDGGDDATAENTRLLLIAPDECLEHRTAPEPRPRSAPEPPPENVGRLRVLTDRVDGLLCGSDFVARGGEDEDEAAAAAAATTTKGRKKASSTLAAAPHPPLAVSRRARRAAAADVLRVHEWSYVRALQAACASIPDSPSLIGHLDGDTAVSARSFDAALVAAGGVCDAVDAVLDGRARHAFCAVRPPGHHAGPSGVVPCANDPQGSHGFCLLNNVAIGGAYAMGARRDRHVSRVCILDFDVHHGNGTQACVGGLAPSTVRHSFSHPFGAGEQSFPVFRPWLDFGDAGNVLFASVQGYGKKGFGDSVSWVYPGSGGTCDTARKEGGGGGEGAAAAAGGGGVGEDGGEAPEAAAAAAAAGEGGDPAEAEFAPDPDAEAPPRAGPRVINVGMAQGPDPPRWRRAWRDKILPAVAAFAPDLILISAGFDAHRKDDINFRYIGVTERDFEWLTQQIVSVANRCCPGRVVSVLEGGYRIQGGPVSAFSRSVAAHVRALAARGGGVYDGEEAAWERGRERAKREKEAMAREAAAAAAAAAAEAAADAAAAAEGAEGGEGGEPMEGVAAAVAAPAAVKDDSDDEEGEDGGRSKRRRRGGGIDYVALNAKLEAEAAAAKEKKGGAK